MPQIAEMFRQAERDVSEVDCFAAAVGPGSFTGVRIGVATVKAMAQAVKKPCVAVSTLHGLANNVAVFDGIICPMGPENVADALIGLLNDKEKQEALSKTCLSRDYSNKESINILYDFIES